MYPVKNLEGCTYRDRVLWQAGRQSERRNLGEVQNFKSLLWIKTFDCPLCLRLRVMRLLLNINFSGVIVILAYKPTITFRFTLWLLSVMNTSIKD